MRDSLREVLKGDNISQKEFQIKGCKNNKKGDEEREKYLKGEWEIERKRMIKTDSKKEENDRVCLSEKRVCVCQRERERERERERVCVCECV